MFKVGDRVTIVKPVFPEQLGRSGVVERVDDSPPNVFVSGGLGWCFEDELGHDDTLEPLSGVDPKEATGMVKAPTGLIPGVAVALEARAMEYGATKHGPWNWRKGDHKVKAMTYLHAAERHIKAYIDGQDTASDSGCHHLAHARASLGILLDALSLDLVDDDRPPKGKAAEYQEPGGGVK